MSNYHEDCDDNDFDDDRCVRYEPDPEEILRDREERKSCKYENDCAADAYERWLYRNS